MMGHTLTLIALFTESPVIWREKKIVHIVIYQFRSIFRRQQAYVFFDFFFFVCKG